VSDSKKEPKPRKAADPEIARANAVGDTAVRVVGILIEKWPDHGGYPLLRSVAIHAIYSEFAAAYGMRAIPIEAAIPEMPSEAAADIRVEINKLPLAELTPEHFGAAHEALTGFDLEDGKVVRTDGRRAGGVHFTPRGLTEPMVLTTLEPIFRSWGAIGPERIVKFQTASPGFHSHDPDGPVDAVEALLGSIVEMPRPETILSLRTCDPSVGSGAFLLSLVRLLGGLLVESWGVHGGAPEDGSLYACAKRLVAVHCAYGVDICRYAVASTKLALTLECHADAMPRDWLDGNIKCGDGLVGLSTDQIKRFHWSPNGKDSRGNEIPIVPEIAAVVDLAMAEGVAARRAEMERLASLARLAA
jgi:hypothetical protein